MSSPYEQGIRARFSGVPQALNPYHYDEIARQNWDDGWEHGVDDDEEIVQ